MGGFVDLNAMGLEASVKGTVERLERERDQLKVQCENLIGALSFYANATASERIADGALAVKVLAEYRKQFPEKN